MQPLSAVVCLVLLAFASANVVKQCPETSRSHDVNVDLTCTKSPCRLRKGTSQHITITFTPDKDISDLKNHVKAEVLGVALPFVGVDGNSICDKVFTESGEKANCPLSAGTRYVYKDSFPILSIYPSIQVPVHWKLKSDDKKDVVCFDVQAKIV